ncbi:MAG: YigZ family protein [Bacillota bacterium]|nr:YigZ family protein [Bacillota bacterium]
MNYYTVQKKAEANISIKKSKFIALLFPFSVEEDFECLMETVRKEWPKARHYCFAYRLHGNPVSERMSDDGEPSGTAGMPMLEILKGANLENVLAVVVRYFGGTLLGTGGLVRAYSDAVREALQIATIQNMVYCKQALLEIDYSYYGQIEKKCLPAVLDKPEIEFGEKIRILVNIPEADYEGILAQYQTLTNRQGTIQETGALYVPGLSVDEGFGIRRQT